MNNRIEFILDGQPVRIDFSQPGLTPTTTLLNYLRTLPGHSGTKEGCAEGDCGACTVVLAEAVNGKLNYRAVDSCLLFLPMIHGKQVITVENLKASNGELHPVQEAIANLHGSQCGFCTPGIALSIFSLYKQQQEPQREFIESGLSGNLCRCTGYRPIYDAAVQACNHRQPDQFDAAEARTIEQLNALNHDDLLLHAGDENYYQPASLASALAVLTEHPGALILNGATDIALRVTKKHETLPLILDLSRVVELKTITSTENTLTLGSGLCLSDVIDAVREPFPALQRMLRVFGSAQIRNLATLGGNIGSASPIGDTLPVLMALDATVHLQSQKEKRAVKLEEFVTAYRQTVRRPDELITAIEIPFTPPGVTVWSHKISKRRELDISTVSAGFRLQRDSDGKVTDIALFYGGMAEMTRRANQTEQFLTGKKWSRATVQQALKLLEQDFTPISDARASAEGRLLAAQNLLLKFVVETAGEEN
jgi:xanthine dehydrogenase small subunit